MTSDNPTSAVYVSTESTRVHLSLKQKTIAEIKRRSEGAMSKGLVIYEAIMLRYPQFEDPLSPIEDRSFSELTEHIPASLSDKLRKNNICIPRTKGDILAKKCDYDSPNEKEKSHVYLPITFEDDVKEEIGPRKVSSTIETAIRDLAQSPWDDRIERLHIMQQLITLFEGESVEDPHWFTDEVLARDDQKYNFVLSEYLPDNKEKEVWEQDLWSMGKLRVEVQNGNIKQTPAERVPALQRMLEQHEYKFLLLDDLIDLVSDVYNCCKKTAEKYVDRLPESLSNDLAIMDQDKADSLDESERCRLYLNHQDDVFIPDQYESKILSRIGSN